MGRNRSRKPGWRSAGVAVSEKKILLEKTKEAVTRRKNSLLRLIQGGVEDHLLLEHRDSLVESYHELERAFGNVESQEEAKYLH